LRPFDLRREYGLLTNVGVEEELEVRERGGRAIQPANGLVRYGKDGLKRCQIECPRIGGKVGGTKARTFSPERVEVT
jgi:hypothetical protein